MQPADNFAKEQLAYYLLQLQAFHFDPHDDYVNSARHRSYTVQ
jgi:hypothetical protein